MLQLDRVQPGELDRDGGGAGDPGGRVIVGDVDLLHVAPGDHVGLRRAAIARDENTAGILQRDDRGAVRQRVARRGPDRADRQQVWRPMPQ